MKIEIKPYTDTETGETYNALYVGGELFDWYVDKENLDRAKKMAGESAFLKKSVMGDIQTHFLNCFSEFVGRPVTVKELIVAIKVGEI